MDYKNINSTSGSSTEQKDKGIIPVVKGTVRKKNFLDKAVDTFIAEDMATIKQHMVEEVVVPGIKRILDETLTNAIHMLLYGTSAPKNSSVFSGVSSVWRFGSGINYSAASTSGNKYSGYSQGNSNLPTYDEIVVPTRAAAEEILDDMKAIIERFGSATINDLYELVSLPGEPTYNNYGWTNLRGADIGSVREGYLLKMPKATLLK